MKTLLLGLLCLLLGLPAATDAEIVYTSSPIVDSEKSLVDYPAFAARAELGALVTGLAEGLVPQGLTYLAESDSFLFAGYRTDGGTSALIEIAREDGRILRQVELRNMDGSVYTGHAGGVCATETGVYISNNHRLYYLSMATYQGLPERADCRFESEIPVPVNASFCSASDGVLWVGEFQYGDGYPTDESHRFQTDAGLYRAWLYGYRLTDGAPGDAPDYILSIPEKIQGAVVSGGVVWLSQSYGRKNSSTLIRYAWSPDEASDAEVTVADQEAPLWALGFSRQKERLISPPMTENLCLAGEKMYVAFESAAQAYRQPANPSRSPVDRVAWLLLAGSP